MGVKSKLSTMLNTTPAPFANTLPYVLLTFHTQSVLDLKYRSAPSFSTQRSALSPCHSEHSAAPLPSFRTQRSTPSVIPNTAPSPPVILNAAPSPPVILNAAQHPFPVILNAAQRSEESKIIAHPPFTDLTFLPSLETTRPKFCHPERNIPSLPFPTALPLCHSEHSTFTPCHSERSAAE